MLPSCCHQVDTRGCNLLSPNCHQVATTVAPIRCCHHVATKLTLEGCNILLPICHQEEAATMLTTDVAIYCHQAATELRLQFDSCHQVATIVPPAWLTSSLIATTGGRFVLHQKVLKLLFKNASKYLHMSFFSLANNCPSECYH